jgi:hypothetical protein
VHFVLPPIVKGEGGGFEWIMQAKKAGYKIKEAKPWNSVF